VKLASPDTRFLLLGAIDPNPNSLTAGEVQTWVDEGIIEWPGNVIDVRGFIRQSSVYVLPSYYREGVPRSSQEAMAMGRPIITTDHVGCRETVIHAVSGFLVPIRDPQALADAMMKFVNKPNLLIEMGARSRELAEARFNVRDANRAILETMGLISRP
jgi:glycosyltransferase involved in cell wall biosynthesis